MKKLLILIALGISMSVMAADLSLTSVHDYTNNQTGLRVSAKSEGFGSYKGFSPVMSYTKMTGFYDRTALGAEYDLMKIGNVNLVASGNGFYQNSVKGNDGYGVNAGLRATYSLTKNIALNATAERNFGQTRLGSDTVTGLGMSIKF